MKVVLPGSTTVHYVCGTRGRNCI